MNSNLRILNCGNYIVTGLDGNGTAYLGELKEIYEDDIVSLPEGTESVTLYVGSMTEQVEEVVLHCIDNSISIIVKYYDEDEVEEVYEFESREEAASILDSIRGRLGGVVNA